MENRKRVVAERRLLERELDRLYFELQAREYDNANRQRELISRLARLDYRAACYWELRLESAIN